MGWEPEPNIRKIGRRERGRERKKLELTRDNSLKIFCFRGPPSATLARAFQTSREENSNGASEGLHLLLHFQVPTPQRSRRGDKGARRHERHVNGDIIACCTSQRRYEQSWVEISIFNLPRPCVDQTFHDDDLNLPCEKIKAVILIFVLNFAISPAMMWIKSCDLDL